uniref:Uncharacterized protein n=1 Tax=Xiphophorus maculatus TaxID=8083 RepID=A0A3B5RFF8_XIPMA
YFQFTIVKMAISQPSSINCRLNNKHSASKFTASMVYPTLCECITSPSPPTQPENFFSIMLHGENKQYGDSESLSDSGRWSDENCSLSLPFVCYKPSNASHFRCFSSHK